MRGKSSQNEVKMRSKINENSIQNQKRRFFKIPITHNGFKLFFEVHGSRKWSKNQWQINEKTMRTVHRKKYGQIKKNELKMAPKSFLFEHRPALWPSQNACNFKSRPVHAQKNVKLFWKKYYEFTFSWKYSKFIIFKSVSKSSIKTKN